VRKTDSKNPADWIWLCESELEALQLLVEKEVAYPMCRSQLAELLEKILKAELIRQGWELIKTHDLSILAGELAARDSDLMDEVNPLTKSLAKVYYINRYPGFDMDDEDWPEIRRLLGTTAALLANVKQRVGAGD